MLYNMEIQINNPEVGVSLNRNSHKGVKYRDSISEGESLSCAVWALGFDLIEFSHLIALILLVLMQKATCPVTLAKWGKARILRQSTELGFSF